MRSIPSIVRAILAIALLPTAAMAAAEGQIRVTTEPPGAMVSCNGILQEVSPVTVTNLAPGPQLIACQKPGFNESRRTVSLLPGQKIAVEFKLEPVNGLIMIHSTPTGADVEIDGAHRGQTPLLLTDLPVGRYRIKATAQGYAPREKDLVIEDRIPGQIIIDLASSSARLIVESSPGGASVSLNGIVRGVTPCEVDRIPEGTNDVEITREDYHPFKQQLRLQAGDVYPIRVNLKPLPARLSLASSPEGARIYIDGQFVREAPFAIDTLARGTHTLRAELQGYETESRTVDITRAEVRIEEFRLTRNSGMLELVTEPAGVKVFVDGVDSGSTKAGESDVLSEPLKIDLLSRGEHRLQLTRKQYFTLEKTFLVEPSKTVSIHEKLKRRFIADTVVRVGPGPNDVRTGVMTQKLPNGDVELETKPGIFVTIKAADIKIVEPLKTQE